jgi:hypothetical protein
MARTRVRIRWSRPLVLAVILYVGVGAVVSGWHWWHLHQEAVQLEVQIAAVDRSNYILQQDLSALHNPVTLRKMLTGQMPLPNALWPSGQP